MRLPPPNIRRRIKQLFAMLGATSGEAANAREKLLKILQEHACSWNDLPDILNDNGAAADDLADYDSKEPATPPDVNPLDLVTTLVERHISMSPDERLAVALWILHTWVYDKFRESPRLALLSPVNGCGKTTLMSLLQSLARYGYSTSNTTPAVIYYQLERNPLTTRLIDEADNLDLHRQSNGVVRSVLNMGHTRGATVCRMIKGKPTKIKVFAPLAIAAIGTLPFPLLRRSVSINMQRPGREHWLERLDDTSPQWAEACDQIRRWAATCKLVSDPPVPSQLRNRAADNWRVLLAIADDLGRGEAARSAAIKMSGNRVYTEPSIALIADIILVFDERRADRLTSKDLVAGLLDLNDGDWNEWRGPKEDRPPHKLSQAELAAMLRPFHIRPRTIWPRNRGAGVSSSRGYMRSWFEQAWDAYCRADTPTQNNKIMPLAEEAA